MGADLDAVLFGEAHGCAHVIEIRTMEAASDVGHVDLGHQAFVVAHLVEAEGLAHVAVNDDHQCCPYPSAAFERSIRKIVDPAQSSTGEWDACRLRQASGRGDCAKQRKGRRW